MDYLTDTVNSFHYPHLATILIRKIPVFCDVASCSLRVCCSEPLVETIDTTRASKMAVKIHKTTISHIPVDRYLHSLIKQL